MSHFRDKILGERGGETKNRIYSEAATAEMLRILRDARPDETTRPLVEEALKNGADPNAGLQLSNHENGTYPALWFACRYHLLETVKLLHAHGANINCIAPGNLPTPLLVLQHDLNWSYDTYQLLDYLVRHGADVETPSQKHRKTPLMNMDYDPHKIAATGIDPVKSILASPRISDVAAYVKQEDEQGNTALHHLLKYAVVKHSIDGLRTLLEKGAKHDVPNKEGYFPFNVFVGMHLGYTAEFTSLRQDTSLPFCRELVKLIDEYGIRTGPVHDAAEGNQEDFLDQALHYELHPLITALVESGKEPTQHTLEYLKENLRVDVNERSAKRLMPLIRHGVYLGDSGADALIDLNIYTKAESMAEYATEHGLRSADFFDEEQHEGICAMLSLMPGGASRFTKELWEAHPEERLTAYAMLPVQARRHLRRELPDLNAYEPVEYERTPEARIAKGKLRLVDYLDKNGHATGQMIAWHDHLDMLSKPEHWQGGANDVFRLQAALPRELSMRMDTASLKREDALPRAESVLASYLRADAVERGRT